MEIYLPILTNLTVLEHVYFTVSNKQAADTSKIVRLTGLDRSKVTRALGKLAKLGVIFKAADYNPYRDREQPGSGRRGKNGRLIDALWVNNGEDSIGQSAEQCKQILKALKKGTHTWCCSGNLVSK